jgi:hypothetical protein
VKADGLSALSGPELEEFSRGMQARKKLLALDDESGNKSRRAKAGGVDPVDDISSMSEEEAEAALAAELSPAHINLELARNLRRIVREGGKAGSDAARLLRELQKDVIIVRKKVVEVCLQSS